MEAEKLCNGTHPLIIDGTCPWCGTRIQEGVLTKMCAGSNVTRKWNLDAFTAVMEHGDTLDRLLAASNLLLHVPLMPYGLDVARKAIYDTDTGVRHMIYDTMEAWGRTLSSDEGVQCGHMLNSWPNDIALRCVLISHYYHRIFESDHARLLRGAHLVWLVRNAPECDMTGRVPAAVDPTMEAELYDDLRSLWHSQLDVYGYDVMVSANAAEFFAHHEREISKTLLAKLQLLDADNARWYERSAQLHVLDLFEATGAARIEAATASLEELKRAWDRTNDYERFWLLGDMARVALETGDAEVARSYAEAFIASSLRPEYARVREYALHRGHIILGTLALRADKSDEARQHLLEAGRREMPLGPNMLLAKELLEGGERKVVVEFLSLCRASWESPNHQADQWIHIIERGGIPDIGPHLCW